MLLKKWFLFRSLLARKNLKKLNFQITLKVGHPNLHVNI